MDWLDLHAVQGTVRVFSNTTVQKYQRFSTEAFFIAQLSHPRAGHLGHHQSQAAAQAAYLRRWTKPGEQRRLVVRRGTLNPPGKIITAPNQHHRVLILMHWVSNAPLKNKALPSNVLTAPIKTSLIIVKNTVYNFYHTHGWIYIIIFLIFLNEWIALST